MSSVLVFEWWMGDIACFGLFDRVYLTFLDCVFLSDNNEFT